MKIKFKKSGLEPKDQIIKLDESVDVVDVNKYPEGVNNYWQSNSYSKYIGKEFRAK